MIILLSGWRHSGKNLVADIIKEQAEFKQAAFADVLKQETSKSTGLPLTFFYDERLKDAPLHSFIVNTQDKLCDMMAVALEKEISVDGQFHTPRSLLIFNGFVKRFLDPDYFVSQFALTSDIDTENYVVSDFRYPNEYHYLEERGIDVITIRINRFDTIDTQDSSERALDNFKFDFVIENKGTKEELSIIVKHLLSNFIYEQDQG